MSQTPSSISPATPQRAEKRRFDVAFIVVAGILLLAAIGLNAAVQHLKLTFRKAPVALQKPLKEIAPQFGPWKQVSVDERLEPEIEESLAAVEYISRDYIDTRRVPADILKQFEGKTTRERHQLISKIASTDPQAYVHMMVTYYTGMVDTVAHIPDRCYVAGGFEQIESETARWNCFLPRGDERASSRYSTYEDKVPGRGARRAQVAYFFHVNGRYTSDSLDVRATLQNLFEKYGYYAKIEVRSDDQNRQRAGEVMDDFLNYALPEVEKSLPDWQKVRSHGTSPNQ